MIQIWHQEKYHGVYYLRKGNILRSVDLFYPEYYQSLVTRLYFFEGKETPAQEPTVYSYEIELKQDGSPYKEITSIRSFDKYQEAVDYISKQDSGNYILASDDPSSNPVPLDALDHCQLVYQSEEMTPVLGSPPIPSVKIFSYQE